MKFLIDEDLSPKVAQYLCENCLIDAVAVRDRGLLGKDDRTVLSYSFNAVKAVETEIKAGREMINRVLYISVTGIIIFQDLP